MFFVVSVGKETMGLKKVVKEKPTSNIDCKIKEDCGACLYINGDYKKSLDIKYQAGLDLLKETGLLDKTELQPPVPSPKVLGYRCSAKLAIRRNPNPKSNDGSERRFAIGLFRPQSHDIVDIDHCPLHKDATNRLIADLRNELEQSTLTPYDEETNTGDLRYIAIRQAHTTDDAMITFVLREESHRTEFRNMILKLRNMGHKIVSAHININPDKTNTIFGSLCKRIIGVDRLREHICDLSFEIGPTSFFQVNVWQAENIYRRVEQLAGQSLLNEVAWDLYCGTGQISMLLANAGYRTLGIELNPQAVRDAQRNVVTNHIENPPSFMAGRVEDESDSMPSWATSPKLIVINPSRKGIVPEVRKVIREKLNADSSCRFIYVSCEIETMARDLADIIGENSSLKQVEAYDMFPYTDKMEWIAVIG